MILHAQESGAGPPVVLLHGLFGMARNLGVLQRRLQPHRRVLALDLRSHGASPQGGMDYAALAGDVAQTLGVLGVGAAVVLGHSMGGKVAMALALAQPGLVSRLVVADIAPLAYAPRFRGHAAAMAAVPAGASRAEAERALAAAVPDPGVRRFLLQNWRDGGWRIGLDAIVAGLPAIEGWDPPPGARYAGPVLVMEGGRSDYVGAAGRAAFGRWFADVRFVVLERAGHWLHVDDPAGVGAAVEEFVGE